jgi:hypothetical protein
MLLQKPPSQPRRFGVNSQEMNVAMFSRDSLPEKSMLLRIAIC